MFFVNSPTEAIARPPNPSPHFLNNPNERDRVKTFTVEAKSAI
ncbi:hypothetical protein [Laspinema sp. D2d]|nr:hypothetical protein [Laspinema sp. D2d]